MNLNDEIAGSELNFIMQETKFTQELSIIIKLDQIKSKKLSKKIRASEEQCRNLAERFDLIELENFRANIDILRSGSSVLVAGSFKAGVIQRCVITLGPVFNHLKGKFSCNYSEVATQNNCDIVDFDLASDDPPEPIIDGEIDVGIVLAEHFGLELDPFPRSPGASLDIMVHEVEAKFDNNNTNPFAVLKKLK